MIEFRQKQFGKALNYLKRGATPISMAALGVSTANYVNNKRKKSQDREFQEQQLQTMKELTKAMKADTKSREESRAENRKHNIFILKRG